jgi:hypothetical protein
MRFNVKRLASFVVSPVLCASIWLPCVASLSAEQQDIDRDKLCYAFLRDGDVWTACRGVENRLSLGGQVRHYAVSPDGAYFAFIRRDSSEYPLGKLVVVSLSENGKAPASDAHYLWLRSTCGTILGEPIRGPFATDILSGQPLNKPPNRFFHCDSDRNIVAGWKTVDGTTIRELTLWVQGNLNKTIRAHINGGNDFDVSPDGKFLSYFREASPKEVDLCILPIGGQPECTEEVGDESGKDGLSLSNAGNVLYAGDTAATCFYKDMEHFSKKRLFGDSGEDACPAIYFGVPSMPRPALIQDLARYPQWITPQTATALSRWKPNTGLH